MKLVIPYTKLELATELYLLDKTVESFEFEVEYKDVSSDHWAYTRVLEELWEQGESFVLMEHDIVPWPGAMSAIAKCHFPWCFYGYTPDTDYLGNRAAPFGLVKFSKDFIQRYYDVWTEMRSYYKSDYEYVWMEHDKWLLQYVVPRKGSNSCDSYRPHQHSPSVFNANSKLLESSQSVRDQG